MDINTNPTPIPGFGQLQTIIGWTAWAAAILAVLAILAFGAILTLSVSRHGETIKGGGKIVGGGAVIGAAASIVGTLTGYSLFNSNPEAVPGLTQIQNIVQWSAWLALGICVLGGLICGIKLVVSFREGNNDGVRNFGSVVAGCLVVGSASTIVGVLICPGTATTTGSNNLQFSSLKGRTMTDNGSDPGIKSFLGGGRTTGFAAVAFAMLLLLCGVFLVLRSGDTAPPADREIPTPIAGPVIPLNPVIQSVDPTSSVALTQAPETTWVLVGRVALPMSPAAGPYEVQGLAASGYQHSALGALLAVANSSYRLVLAGDQDWKAVTDAAVVSGPTGDAWRKLRSTISTGPTDLTREYTQITGFQFLSYSSFVAVIQLVTVDDNGSLQVAAYNAQWIAGDWKFVPAAGGKLTTSSQRLTSLMGFIAWKGVS